MKEVAELRIEEDVNPNVNNVQFPYSERSASSNSNHFLMPMALFCSLFEVCGFHVNGSGFLKGARNMGCRSIAWGGNPRVGARKNFSS